MKATTTPIFGFPVENHDPADKQQREDADGLQSADEDFRPKLELEDVETYPIDRFDCVAVPGIVGDGMAISFVSVIHAAEATRVKA